MTVRKDTGPVFLKKTLMSASHFEKMTRKKWRVIFTPVHHSDTFLQ